MWGMRGGKGRFSVEENILGYVHVLINLCLCPMCLFLSYMYCNGYSGPTFYLFTHAPTPFLLRYLRMAAGEQIFVLAAQCSQDPQQLLCLVNLLIAAQEHVASSLSSTSSEYFKLLARLLSHAINSNIQLPDVSAFLDRELQWIQIQGVKVCVWVGGVGIHTVWLGTVYTHSLAHSEDV